MNNEIKEILERIKTYPEKLYCLSEKEKRILLDYITNLQQENEYLKLSNPEMNIEHFRIINENKRKIDNLRKQNKDLQQENERLKQEYINVRNYIKMRNVSTEVEDKALLYNIELENINKKKYLDYKSRCEKAIEYINNHKEPLHHSFDEPDCDYWIATNPDVLLNILQNGSDSQ